MCCTKFFCRSNLVVGDINRNNCTCTTDSCTLNCIETNSTCADNNDVTTSRNFCSIGDGSKTSDDTARKERCTCHWNIFWNCDAL